METISVAKRDLASPLSWHGNTGHDHADQHAEQRLEVFVIFTDTPGTLAALQMADRLAKRLEARLRLVMPYEVPYTLPLTEPTVAVEFLEGQLRSLAGQVPTEIAAHIYLCRDRQRALRVVLKARSLAIVGGRKRWWPTPAQRLARALSKDGHHVLFAELR